MIKADVLLGLQWGDEGKGKIVDVLTPKAVKASISFLKITGSITTPLPITFKAVG